MEEKKEEFAYEKSINSAIPIWEALGMSEEEYMKKYGQPFTIQEEKQGIIKIEVNNLVYSLSKQTI